MKKKQLIWVFELRESVHYWWSYISFSPECKELTSMLDLLLYRWGVPPVFIRCVHWTMQMWVLQTWVTAQGPAIVMCCRCCFYYYMVYAVLKYEFSINKDTKVLFIIKLVQGHHAHGIHIHIDWVLAPLLHICLTKWGRRTSPICIMIYSQAEHVFVRLHGHSWSCVWCSARLYVRKQ